MNSDSDEWPRATSALIPPVSNIAGQTRGLSLLHYAEYSVQCINKTGRLGSRLEWRHHFRPYLVYIFIVDRSV